MTSGGRYRSGPARLVAKLVWRRLRSHPLRVVLAAVAVAAGVASVSSVLVVRHSVAASVADGRAAMAGIADLRVDSAVRGRGLTPEAIDAAAGVPGVASAAPAVEAVTLADPPPGRDGERRRPSTALVLGVDCRLARAAGFPVCLHDLLNGATGRPVAAGPDVPLGSLRVAGGTMSLRKVPVVDELGDYGIGNLVILSLADAQQAFARGDRVDSLYVTATTGSDVAELHRRLATTLGDGVEVSGADEAPTSLRPALGHFLPVSSLVAVLALLLSGALVYTTLTMSLAESRRSMAIARALGASRGLVRMTHLLEATVVGLVGGLAGAAVGTLVARPMVDSLSAAVKQVVNIELGLYHPPRLWLVGAAVGLGTALLAALPAIRAAGRGQVVAGLAVTGDDDAIGPPVAGPLVWALCGAVGVGAIVVAARVGGLEGWGVPVGVAGFGCLALALVFGGAESVALAGRPLTAGPLRRRPVTSLAVVNLSRSPRRTAAVVTVVAATLVSSFVLGGFVAGNRSGVIERLAGPGDRSVYVSMAGTNVPETLDVGLDPGIVGELAALPGVRSVRRDAEGSFDGHDVEVRTVVAGMGANMTGAIVAQDVADHVDVGPAVPVVVGGRVADVPMLVTEVDPRADEGSVRIDRKSFLGAFGDEPVTSLEVEAVTGTSPDDLAAVIEQVDGAAGLRVRVAQQYATDRSAHLYKLLEPYRVLQAWLLILGLITMSATLVLSGLQRRREIGLIRAVGLSRNGIGRLVLGEALLIWVISLVLSTIAGPVLLRAFLAIEALLVGTEDPFRPAWAPFTAYAGIVFALAALAAVWPALGATRVSVVEALDDDP